VGALAQNVQPAEVVFDGTITKVGFFGVSGVTSRPSPVGETVGSSLNTDATDATFTGGTGPAAYTVGDIVKILKSYGLLEN